MKRILLTLLGVASGFVGYVPVRWSLAFNGLEGYNSVLDTAFFAILVASGALLFCWPRGRLLLVPLPVAFATTAMLGGPAEEWSTSQAITAVRHHVQLPKELELAEGFYQNPHDGTCVYGYLHSPNAAALVRHSLGSGWFERSGWGAPLLSSNRLFLRGNTQVEVIPQFAAPSHAPETLVRVTLR